MRAELQAPPRTLMVKQDARTRKQVIALAVIDGNPMPIELRDAVRTPGIKRGALGLGDFLNLTKHLAGRGLIKTNLGIDNANGLQHLGDAEGSELARQDGL